MSGTQRRHEPELAARRQPGAGSALLIGADGMLGRAMSTVLRERGWEILAPPIDELDLSNPASLERAAVRTDWFERFTHVVNCAAWTDVDGAEANESAATAVNGRAIEALAAACASWGSRFVNYSTDYVFDGTGTCPYRVDAPRSPLNAYGRSKAAGEAALERSTCHWLNIRTSWLYAPWGRNFVLTIRKLLFEKPEIKVVSDQRGRPTSAEHLARVTISLLGQGARGHWHATDGGECTWHEFAGEIGRLAGAPGRVAPCTSAEFSRPAKRPAYSVLDISKTEAAIGPMPRWQDNLADVVRRIGP